MNSSEFTSAEYFRWKKSNFYCAYVVKSVLSFSESLNVSAYQRWVDRSLYWTVKQHIKNYFKPLLYAIVVIGKANYFNEETQQSEDRRK